MRISSGIWNKQFIMLNAAIFLAFANIAFFFHFYEYLQTLPIAPGWFGFLIGIFSAVSLVLRPLVSPFMRPDNSLPWAIVGTIAVIVALQLYSIAGNFSSMLGVRIFHGAAHVAMATALMSLIVGYIPKEKSGQAFGLLSITTLLPYAVIPPVLSPIVNRADSFPHILALFGLPMALALPLLLAFGRQKSEVPKKMSQKLGGREILRNLKDVRVLLLFSAMLLLYSGYALVFFYVADYAEAMGIANAGFFFTISTLGEISVRVLAGSWFDSSNKALLAAWSLISLFFGYLALAYVPGAFGFYALGGFLGLGWGIVMPVLNALVFDVSEPKFKALNTNLGVQMFQCGFFVGPLLGGIVLNHNTIRVVFLLCSVMSIMAAGMMFYLVARTRVHETA